MLNKSYPMWDHRYIHTYMYLDDISPIKIVSHNNKIYVLTSHAFFKIKHFHQTSPTSQKNDLHDANSKITMHFNE